MKLAESSPKNPKSGNKWEDKKAKPAFNYDLDADDDFMEELGFKKGDDMEESISKFSSHAAYDPQLPTKSELMRTDSNAITEENVDYNSANVSSVNDTEKIDDDADMEDLLMHASQADIGFMKQSLTNFQEMMAKEAEDMKKVTARGVFKAKKHEIKEADRESDDDY